jgi:hypothetical protein
VADEPEALAGHGADQTLVLTAVANGFARSIDVAVQGGFGDDPPTAHHLEQVILGDDVLTIANEIEQ